MKKVGIKEKIAVGSLGAMLVSNPLTGQYVLQGLDWLFSQMFVYGAYVSIATTVYLVGLGAWYYHKSEQVNIPSKAKATKAQRYLEA